MRKKIRYAGNSNSSRFYDEIKSVFKSHNYTAGHSINIFYYVSYVQEKRENPSFLQVNLP